MEIDFPREDLSVSRKRRGIYSGDNETTNVKQQSIKNEPKSEYDGVWNQRITPNFLTEGMLGLGVVMKIKEAEILLECLDGVVVKVPVQNFGNLMLGTLRSSSLTLEDVFKKVRSEQFVAVDSKEKKKASYPVVSCDPLIVNVHLNPGALINGLVLNGVVESVEDKGVIINLGLQSVELKGFLAEKHLPPTFQKESLIEGQPLLLRIQNENSSNKKSRVVSLSAVPEMECLDDIAVKNLKLNDLMPGTLLLVNPLQPTASGVYVNIGNDIKGYVNRQHLPPRYRNDSFKCLKSFKTIVMFCQQNSNLLALNGHPDIIAASKFAKRTNFENVHTGDIIECKVSNVNKNGDVNFDLVLHGDERNSLVAAFARKTELEDHVEYKKGTIHQTRVLSFKMVERILIVATRKDILAQKMVCVKDAVPGMKVIAKVESVLPKGLFVKIYNSIPGFIPKIHLSDKLITRIDKHFAVGDELTCRILTVNEAKERLILTNKQSLTTNKDTVIKSYAEVTTNAITTGYIVSQHPSGGLIIGFYGGTRGFMFPKETERLGTNIKVGLTVRVRVVSVDPQRGRMLVAVANAANDGTEIAKAQPFLIDGGNSVSFSAVVMNILSNDNKSKPNEILNVTVRLGKKLGGKVKAFIPKELLSDCLDLPFASLSESIALGSVLPKVTVLGDVAGNLKVTSKRFMIDWLEKHPRITGLQNLTKGELVCGNIIRKHKEMGYFVELAGGSALTAPARFIRPMALPVSMQELQIGQTVVARVSSVDLERKRFALILDAHLCIPPGAELDYFAPSIVHYSLEELNWFIANNPNYSQVPEIGECIDIKVVEISECSVVVQYASNPDLKGCAINNTNILQKGSCAKALVLDVKLPTCELVLFLLDGGVQHLNEKKLQSLLCSKKEFDAKIWLHKREYAVATVETEKSAFVVSIPMRLHPNVNITSVDLDENSNQCIITPKLISGNVMIGTAMEILKKYGLIHRKFKTPIKSAVKKKLKQFKIYTAKVMGMWSKGDLYNAIELELPDGSIGRLHASEFDESFLDQTSQPIQSFLKKRKGKTVNVKIMCFTKLKQKMEKLDLSKPRGKGTQKGEKMVVVTRLAECTMKTWKLSETKRKQSLLGYPQSYVHGSFIPVFVCNGPHVGVVRVEVSPLWNGVIRKQNLYDENLLANPTNNDASALVDIDFEPGEKLIAQVIGVNVYKNRRGKLRHRKCLEMTLKKNTKENRSLQTFEHGDRVTGRVVGITQSPSSVILELTNNQRAVLTLTGITDNYLNAHEAVKSYELNQIYNVHLLRFDNDKGRWLAVTESRFSKKSKNMLYRSGTDIEISSKLQAFVTSASDDAHIFVEISPGITGCVSRCKKLSLKPDDLITVRVSHTFADGGLKVEFVDLIAEGPPDEKPRKRLISVGSGSDIAVDLPRKKSKAAGYVASHLKENEPPQVTVVEAKLPEPGLDWSLKGFTPAEFAKVGQLGQKVDVPVSTSIAKDESSADNIEEQNRPKTKEELQIEEEKKLINRERKILEANWIPDNTNDFDRLVAGTPNSSILWIRYITFFLEQNDVEKARAVADRALSVINFREEDEIFNVWTAYLNLEGNFGTSESLKAVFDNAIKNTDALKMYKQMVKIYQNLGKIQELDDLLDEMLKRFRHDDLDVWFIYGQHLLETKRPDKARDLMKKAINCLSRKHHVTILSRFAQLEFKFGDMEQSKTIFENILNSYPKKTDVWTVYIDLLIKVGKFEDARQLLERVTALKLSTHKIRLFFKKWVGLEQMHGDEEQQNNVKERALHYLQDVTGLIKET
ncbi:S1 RNA binding domain-containing protein [Loa loa]|uniref:S1 RNA binding domain-containing protein n=1 Tax=Loa loa TaxID=7209 RepID=A0A1S0UIZ7_LOALO|nr:S1 RNA binding domain-containing protein [Loa loa]EJD75660.1 S1 RNA binding domain-containing protein [Loa loa]